VIRLAREGIQTIAHYGHSSDHAEATVREASKVGPTPKLLQADLGDIDSVQQLAKAVFAQSTEGLDGIIHNAGIAPRMPFAAVTPSVLDELYAINIRAPFLLTQLLNGHLNENASIVFLSSVATRQQFEGLSAYAMTKAAIEALVVQIANEMGARGIRVNAIAPGAVSTDMNPSLQTAAGAEAAIGRQALKRIALAEDVADAIAMLLSHDARWITGTVLPVSGGTKL
jgi:NAD(P)-dependent dehydrogenase (short-subunit alcohol dehydrogenase family)